MSIIKFYLELIKKRFKKFISLVLGLLIISGLGILVASLYMHIIDCLGKVSIIRVTGLLLIYILINLVIGILECCIKIFTQRLKCDLELEYQEKVFDALLRQKGEFFSKNVSGEFITYLISDITSIVGFISNSLLPVLQDTVKGVGILCFLCFLNWKLLLILMLAQPAIWIVQKKMQKTVQKLSEENRVVFRDFIDVTREYCENLLNIVMISAEHYVKGKYSKILIKQKIINIKMIQLDSINRLILGILYLIPICAILLAGSYEMQYKKLTLGGLLLFIQYSGTVTRPIESIYDLFYHISGLKPSIERIFNLFSIKSNFSELELTDEINNIGLRNATFSYHGEIVIFQNSSLEFQIGNSYAIIGKSGIGKSTLSKILLGIWPLNDGYIFINNKELAKDVCIKEYITYIAQSDFILNDTIYNNIVLGDETISNKKFKYAILVSELDSVLSNLKLREETKMGDCGNLFSGGEKQRVGIARALIKDNPIVIFDEPTSGLDRDTGEKIVNKLIDIFSNRILIIISHDELIYSKCDYTCILEHNKIKIHRNER